MAKNKNLHKANKAKNDEFYTQFQDIQKEVNAYIEYNKDVFKDKVIFLPCDDPEWSNFTKFFAQNFEKFGIKKLISTSYATENKSYYKKGEYATTLFEMASPKYDPNKTKSHGKIFTLEKDENKSGKIDIEDLDFEYLKGDGDFRSEEVKLLRDESDIIITNPPFSLFREFVEWIMEVEKEFLIIGNKNAITYKEIFKLLKETKVWLGVTTPTDFLNEKMVLSKKLTGLTKWFTNLDHGRRHRPLQLMTMEDNIKFNKKIKGGEYQKYDNYDAIEVPYTDAIPSDYNGIMGVPITFLDKYNPDQFEILGLDRYTVPQEYLVGGRVAINGKPKYARILIKWKKDAPGFLGKGK